MSVTTSIANAIPTSTLTMSISEDTQLAQLVHVSKTVFEQAIDLVQNHMTCDAELTTESKHLPGSSIGKHLRHARDHFHLLADCMLGSATPRILSYDVRVRNTPMESSRIHALEALHDQLVQLDKILEVEPAVDEPIILNAVTPYPQTLQTSFARELWFAALHMVHHLGMVRVIASEIGITSLPHDFGFAPSTLVHHDREAPLGKLVNAKI